jgi:hypothetical protein
LHSDLHSGENDGSNKLTDGNTAIKGGSDGKTDATNKGIMNKGDNVVDGKASDDKKEGNSERTEEIDGDIKKNDVNVNEDKSINKDTNIAKIDFNNGSNDGSGNKSCNENSNKITNNPSDSKTDDADSSEKSSDKNKKNDSNVPSDSATSTSTFTTTSNLSNDSKSASSNSQQKRGLADETSDDSTTQNDEEIKRKRRKENEDPFKDIQEGSTKQGINSGKASELSSKIASHTAIDKKSPCASPRPPKIDVDSAADDSKNSDDTSPKVPPLKIVIPQQNNGSTYVVATSCNASDEKDTNSARSSPESTKNLDEKLDKAAIDEKAQQRILRSSHKTDRSNNSSPQLQPNSPSAAPLNENFPVNQTTSGNTTSYAQPSVSTSSDAVDPISVASPVNQQFNSNSNFSVDINHPRKWKIRTNKDMATPSIASTPVVSNEEKQELPETPAEHEHQSNNYQMFLNIRKQIERKHRNLMPVQPKPPSGFKDYLLNRRTYVLAGKTPNEPVVVVPTDIPEEMKEFFTMQENERYKLKMQHIVEKEKLVLSVEQEILRVHGRAARSEFS